MYAHTNTHSHSINQIRGSSRESGCLMASGLIWDADVVLLLPLMRSGGVQSNIGRRGCDTAPRACGPGGCRLIQWTRAGCDLTGAEWSGAAQSPGRDVDAHASRRWSVHLLTKWIAELWAWINHASRKSTTVIAESKQASICCWWRTVILFITLIFRFLQMVLVTWFSHKTPCNFISNTLKCLKLPPRVPAVTMTGLLDVCVCCLDCLTGIRVNTFSRSGRGEAHWGSRGQIRGPLGSSSADSGYSR